MTVARPPLKVEKKVDCPNCLAPSTLQRHLMYRRIQLLNWSFNDFSLQTENYTIAIAVPLSLHDDIDIGEPLALRAH